MIIDQPRAKTFVYATELSDWDETASVRVKPRRILVDEESEGNLYFSPELAPETQHSKVQSLGDRAIREILVQRLHAYLESLTQIEQDVVNRVTLEVAQQKIGVSLPWDLAFDAFKVYTDESYHSLISFDLGHQIELKTGVKPHPIDQYHCLARLEELISLVPWDLRQLADIFSVIACEMLVIPNLSIMSNDPRMVHTVREVLADHILDEEKHFEYYSKLLEFLWSLLSEREIKEVGLLLPEFMLAFLEPDFAAIIRALADYDLTPEEIQQIIDESYPRYQIIDQARLQARAALQQFERLGLFEDQRMVEAFRSSNLID